MDTSKNNLADIFASALGISKENDSELYDMLQRSESLMNEESESRTRFESLMNNVGRNDTDHLLIFMGTHGFFYRPASIKNDYAYKGGLVKHSLDVYDAAMKIRDEMLSEDPTISSCLDEDSVTIVSLLHDFCKIDEYDLDKNDIPCYEEGPFPIGGHGDKSVIMIQEEHYLLLPDEIIAIWWHMGESACTSPRDKELYKKALENPLCKLLVKAVSQVSNKE